MRFLFRPGTLKDPITRISLGRPGTLKDPITGISLGRPGTLKDPSRASRWAGGGPLRTHHAHLAGPAEDP